MIKISGPVKTSIQIMYFPSDNTLPRSTIFTMLYIHAPEGKGPESTFLEDLAGNVYFSRHTNPFAGLVRTPRGAQILSNMPCNSSCG